MNASLYGINIDSTIIFLSIGCLIGILWQSTTFPQKIGEKAFSFTTLINQSLGVIFLSFLVIFSSYLIVGYDLTEYIYSCLAAGFILECIVTKVGEVIILSILHISRVISKQKVNSNNATWRTLPPNQLR
ncbi:MAG TPA: hypothetical protein VN711_05090 [Candidatus Saccharimonadales bacterium]|nr:hypothetical protein [Candidatus Saccharimonadales bacterium]